MAMAAAAADVSGKWSGTFTPEGRDASSAYAILKQTGAALTGSAGPSEGIQWPGLTGSIQGSKVTIEVKSAEDGTVYKCVLVLTGDHLKGDVAASGADGRAVKATMDLTRVK
jgi:hypothetical protein